MICTVSSMPFSYQPGVNDIQTVDLEGLKSLIPSKCWAEMIREVYELDPMICPNCGSLAVLMTSMSAAR